ncbi:hypothetical protein ACFXNW_17450 [Nocardia sp. NPDC059180]|uniref:hypothetical protein n=1 Tax=Nocardia sp. NPDC059180 TaxID=3346761 RepID=UPI00369F8A83
MNKIALRAAIAAAAVAPMVVLGAGAASAGPIMGPSPNPGEVIILEPTATENWNCTLWGQWKVGRASTPLAFESGFVPGTQVTALCLGDTIPWVSFLNTPAGT